MHSLIPEQSRVVDLQFREFVAGPISVIHPIYDRFGLEFLPETEAQMREYLRTNPSDRDGTHRHSLDESGPDESGPDIEAEHAQVKRCQE